MRANYIFEKKKNEIHCDVNREQVKDPDLQLKVCIVSLFQFFDSVLVFRKAQEVLLHGSELRAEMDFTNSIYWRRLTPKGSGTLLRCSPSTGPLTGTPSEHGTARCKLCPLNIL